MVAFSRRCERQRMWDRLLQEQADQEGLRDDYEVLRVLRVSGIHGVGRRRRVGRYVGGKFYRPSTGLRPSLLLRPKGVVTDGGTVYGDWHLDTVNGDDGNDGLTDQSAFATLDKVKSVYSAGETVAIATDSVVRERWNDLSLHGGTIIYYGDGAAPKIRADDIADPGDFTPHATKANVYEISWTLGEEGTESYLSVWVNGTRLQRVAQANTEATAGGYYAPNPDGSTGTYTIEVHLSGDADPRSSGDVVEITSRMTCLALGNNWVINGIRTMRNGTKNGSLWVGTGSTVVDCIFEDGVIHNALIGTGTMTDCYAWKCDRSDIIGQQNMIQGNTSGGSGETLHFLRVWVVGSVDPSLGVGAGQAANNTAIHVHSDGNSTPYATVIYEDCVALYMGGGFAITNAQNAWFKGCVIHDSLGGLAGQGAGVSGGGKMYVQHCRIYGHQTYNTLRSIAGTPEELYLGDESEDIPAGIFAHKSVSGGAFFISQNTEIKEMYRGLDCLLNFVSGNRNAYDDGADGAYFLHRTKWISDGWLIGWSLGSAGTTVISADTGVSASSADNSYNHAGWTSNPAVGEWVRITGFATAANNGYKKVVSANGTKIVVDATLTDEAAGEAVTIVKRPSFIINSDDNIIFPSTMDQRVANTNYADVPAYAAATGNDTGSSTTDPVTVDNGGSIEPIVECTSAPPGYGPNFGSYTLDLTRSTIEATLSAA
jgi:hypothetical protein